MSNPDNRFNSPAEILVRVIFVVPFPLFLAGLTQAALAFQYGSVHHVLKAAVCFAVATVAHYWLERCGKLGECYAALDGMLSHDSPAAEDELETLIEKRSELEAHRGEPGFDPWAVQAVRREISDYLRTHPQSTERLGIDKD